MFGLRSAIASIKNAMLPSESEFILGDPYFKNQDKTDNHFGPCVKRRTSTEKSDKMCNLKATKEF